MDKDTKQLLSDGDHVEALTRSDGWNIVKPKLDQRILDLQNINNLDMEKPETLSIQLMARRMAVDMVWAWLKDDVYGFIDQQKANAEKETKEVEPYISRES